MGFQNSVKIIQKTLALNFNRKPTFESTKTVQISGTLCHLETKSKGFTTLTKLKSQAKALNTDFKWSMEGLCYIQLHQVKLVALSSTH